MKYMLDNGQTLAECIAELTAKKLFQKLADKGVALGGIIAIKEDQMADIVKIGIDAALECVEIAAKYKQEAASE